MLLGRVIGTVVPAMLVDELSAERRQAANALIESSDR